MYQYHTHTQRSSNIQYHVGMECCNGAYVSQIMSKACINYVPPTYSPILLTPTSMTRDGGIHWNGTVVVVVVAVWSRSHRVVGGGGFGDAKKSLQGKGVRTTASSKKVRSTESSAMNIRDGAYTSTTTNYYHHHSQGLTSYYYHYYWQVVRHGTTTTIARSSSSS